MLTALTPASLVELFSVSGQVTMPLADCFEQQRISINDYIGAQISSVEHGTVTVLQPNGSGDVYFCPDDVLVNLRDGTTALFRRLPCQGDVVCSVKNIDKEQSVVAMGEGVEGGILTMTGMSSRLVSAQLERIIGSAHVMVESVKFRTNQRHVFDLGSQGGARMSYEVEGREFEIALVNTNNLQSGQVVNVTTSKGISKRTLLDEVSLDNWASFVKSGKNNQAHELFGCRHFVLITDKGWAIEVNVNTFFDRIGYLIIAEGTTIPFTIDSLENLLGLQEGSLNIARVFKLEQRTDYEYSSLSGEE